MRRTRERPGRRGPAPGPPPSRLHRTDRPGDDGDPDRVAAATLAPGRRRGRWLRRPATTLGVAAVLAAVAVAGCGGDDGDGPPPRIEARTPRPATAPARAVRCTTENAQRQMATMVHLSFREGLGAFDLTVADGWCGKHAGRTGLVPGRFESVVTNTDGREGGVEIGVSATHRTGRYLARLHQFVYGIGCEPAPGVVVRTRLAHGLHRSTLPPGTSLAGGAAALKARDAPATRGGIVSWDAGARCRHTGSLLIEVGYGRGEDPPVLPPVVWFGRTTTGARIAMGPTGGRGRPALDAHGRPAPGATSPRGSCSSTSGDRTGACAFATRES